MIGQERYAPVAWWKHLVAAAIGFSVIAVASALAAPWADELWFFAEERSQQNPSNIAFAMNFGAEILAGHTEWLANSFENLWQIPTIFGFLMGPILLAVSIWPRTSVHRRAALPIIIILNACFWGGLAFVVETMNFPEPMRWELLGDRFVLVISVRVALSCVLFGLGYMAVLRLLFLRPPPPIEETFD